jgi:hypothetical protein
MIAYKWSIDKLQVAEDNLVIKVECRVTATQDVTGQIERQLAKKATELALPWAV